MSRKNAKNKLTDPQKRQVVQWLAEGSGLTEIADALKQAHGITISPQSIAYYQSPRALKKWGDFYEQCRKKYLDDFDRIPETHPAIQVRQLVKMFREARDRGSLPEARCCLAEIRDIALKFRSYLPQADNGDDDEYINSLSEAELWVVAYGPQK